jgi:hypothetical protein
MLNIKIFLLCPIPDGQKPINEYITYKENFLTSLINSQKRNSFFFKWYFSIFFSLSFLNDFKNFSISLLIQNFLLTNFLFLTFYFINFIKWKTLEKRFQNSRIIYEEGSWYDSQIWEKPFLLIKNDKLIENQRIKPIIQELFRSVLYLIYFTIFLLLIFFIVNN